MIKLIINADDFGMTDAITDAIVESHIHGIVSSTTMMPNMQGFDYAIQMAKLHKNLGVGIHLNLTEGKPISEKHKVNLLLDDNGCFLPNHLQRKNLIYGKDVLMQAKLELKNQFIKLLDNGVVPTHFDGHHHIVGTPLAMRAAMHAASEFKIFKARITNVDFKFKNRNISNIKYTIPMIKSFPKSIIHKANKIYLNSKNFITPDSKVIPGRVVPLKNNNIEQFIDVLSILKKGVYEIAVHPGYKNSNPDDSPKTSLLRLSDFEIVNSEAVKEYILINNITLINFNHIK